MVFLLPPISNLMSFSFNSFDLFDKDDVDMLLFELFGPYFGPLYVSVSNILAITLPLVNFSFFGYGFIVLGILARSSNISFSSKLTGAVLLPNKF